MSPRTLRFLVIALGTTVVLCGACATLWASLAWFVGLSPQWLVLLEAALTGLAVAITHSALNPPPPELVTNVFQIHENRPAA